MITGSLLALLRRAREFGGLDGGSGHTAPCLHVAPRIGGDIDVTCHRVTRIALVLL
jgi:hypothetical protein